MASLFTKTKLYIEALSKKYEVNTVNIGSALKLCLVAEGKAHIYPRYAPTMEWDTCAPDLIVNEAGGKLIDLFGKQRRYNQEDPLITPGLIAGESNAVEKTFSVLKAL